MIGKTRWWPGLSLGAIGVIAVLGFADGRSTDQTAAQILAGRPECPHDWDFKGEQMAIVGNNIDIPEFHDCQRFITIGRRGQQTDTAYQALYAIFAADTLRTMGSITVGTWVPVAEIYAEGAYSHLGIVLGYNCLFMSRVVDTVFVARMVPVAGPDVDCGTIPGNTAQGTDLTVYAYDSRFFGARLGWRDFPPVARWDWDSRTEKQYIGVKCGEAWCEIGYRDLSRRSKPNVTGLGLDPYSHMARTRVVKGWYDEQLLAVRDDRGRTVTSAIRGIIYPDTALDGYQDQTAFDSKWLPVAQVALEVPPNTPTRVKDQYKASMNFDATAPGAALRSTGRLNKISLCRGTATACAVEGTPPTCSGDLPAWWSRIEPANGGPAKYYCVTRRGHGLLGHHIPGTARWRWLASDERTWKACVQGCCETGPS